MARRHLASAGAFVVALVGTALSGPGTARADALDGGGSTAGWAVGGAVALAATLLAGFAAARRRRDTPSG